MKWCTGKTYRIGKPMLKKKFDTEYNKKVQNLLDDPTTKFSKIHNALLGDTQERVAIISPTNSVNSKEIQELKEMKNNCFTTHLHIKTLLDQSREDKCDF